ncbi:MAG TPA: hypothetical protein VFZ33_02090 [Chitinophagaceae bacterium]
MARGLCFLNGLNFILSSNKITQIEVLNEGDPETRTGRFTIQFDITNSNFEIVEDGEKPKYDALMTYELNPKLITLKGEPEIFLRYQNGDIFFLEVKIPIEATKVDHGQGILEE